MRDAGIALGKRYGKEKRNGYYKFSVGGKTVEVVTIKFSKHFFNKNNVKFL